jgi:pimeloyl-ACP methyl ester carboxylesterase
MRPFEIILVCALLAFLMRLVIFPNHKNIWLSILLLSAFAVLQIVIEGIRWQMFPSYFLILLLLIPAFLEKKFIRKMFLFLACFTFIIAVFLPVFFPVFSFDKPTGKYQIGTITYHFTDSLRNEIFTSKVDDKREIMLQIWYPTNNHTNKNFAPYIENGNTVTDALAEFFGYPTFFFTHLKYVKSNAVPNAAISNDKAKYPVLIYLTGVNGSRHFSNFQIQELVSQGYIVAGIDNPGAVASVCFPDSRNIKGLPIENIKALINQSVENLPTIPALNNIEYEDGIIPFFSEDVSFAINCLEKINENDFQKILSHHIDITKIGVFGVSLGGIVAAEAAANDNRIKACLIMESPISKNVMKSGLQIPTMIMTRDAATMRLERKKSGGWSEKDIQTHQYTMRNIYDRLPSDGYFIQIPKIFHLDFIDTPLWFPFARYIGLTGQMKTKDAHQIINMLSVAFFDKELKRTSSEFLNHVNEKYPDIIYLKK